MSDRPIVIIGAGGMGREALAWVHEAFPDREVAGFVDDRADAGTAIAGLLVLGGEPWLLDNDADGVVAIGAPAERRSVTERLRRRAIVPLTLVHPTAYLGPNVAVGQGSIICPNVTLTRDIVLGDGVIVNYGAQIGHDSEISDWAFVAPGVSLAGNVTVGTGAELGIGTSVIQGVTIGAWSRIGAGAAVVRDIPDRATAFGVPCRPQVQGR